MGENCYYNGPSNMVIGSQGLCSMEFWNRRRHDKENENGHSVSPQLKHELKETYEVPYRWQPNCITST
jgi:hypothetical protein